MTAYVFVGPTVDAGQVQAQLECTCLPPAAHGDVYRASLERPVAIGLIDGYFQGVASVWHKEILWALSRGIHVFGSASMGALRAAELSCFGMRGVGRVFEQFRDGILEDDDEVAVLHGPAEVSFKPLSEPLVNIRATLTRAAQDEIIPPSSAGCLLDLARSTSYQDRCWDRLLAPGSGHDLPTAEIEALAAWLPAGRIDVKRADALQMARSMQRFLATGPAPHDASFHFEWTHLWQEVVDRESTPRERLAVTGGGLAAARILDELRLDPDAYRAVELAALLRRLAARGAEVAAPAAVRDRHNAFRSERGLLTRSALVHWLEQNRLDDAALEDLLVQDLGVEQMLALHRDSLDPEMLSELRMRGTFSRLAARAEDKHATLIARGQPDPEPSIVGGTPPQLLAWFFGARLGTPIPEDIDALVRRLGLPDRGALYRFLTREYLYSRHEQDEYPYPGHEQEE